MRHSNSSLLLLLLPLLLILTLTLLSLPSVDAKKIADCCCDAETVDIGNDDLLFERLQQLRKLSFFRIFKVNLYSECPFWKSDSQCARRTCAVSCDCPHNEKPEPWLIDTTDHVDRTMSSSFQPWKEKDDALWIVQDDSKSMSFVDMALNPEAYTGYEGFAAHRIWSAIYGQNCFTTPSPEAMCYEQRVFYRLISGLHASIACHISNSYPIGNIDPNSEIFINSPLVGPNITQYSYRVGNHPDRLNNLYFAFVFMLRAVNKATPWLIKYDYSTGNVTEDQMVQTLLNDILTDSLVTHCSSSESFNENLMFNTFNTIPMKNQFKNAFRNISRIMDCLGCEKCKLHGKLQILGIGTALKVLFEDESNIKLARNEIVALLYTLSKFSNAIKVVHDMDARIQAANQASEAFLSKHFNTILLASVAGLVFTIIFLLRTLCSRPAVNKNEKTE